MNSGFFINTDFPFLGTTPDGSVYDPSEPEQPFGYLEVKCPYSYTSRSMFYTKLLLQP